MEFITKSAEETQEIGRRLSADLRGGEIIALHGDLGAGKTTFVQGLAEGLGITSRVNSPTFIIMRNYETDRIGFYHVDLYRLEDNVKEELDNLGITDMWGKEETIFVIEWAERIKEYLPPSTKWITFENIDLETRKITIQQ